MSSVTGGTNSHTDSSPSSAVARTTTSAGHIRLNGTRKKDAEFWFSDGTIILIVQNIEFRVYKGLLAERFPVFKDMLSFPQPATVSDPTRTGTCPIVDLAGDSARDWRNVFRLFMPKEEYSFFKQQPPYPNFEALAACVRLGHKYQMSQLLGHAIDYLQDHFTHKFDRWETHTHWLPLGSGFNWSHAIGVVNLARLTGETRMLPTALWLCTMLGADATKGMTYSDGEVERLSPEDLGLCIEGSRKLVQQTFLMVMRYFSPPLADSCKAASCKCAGLDVLATVSTMVVSAKKSPNPLLAYTAETMGVFLKGLCAGCVATVRERQKTGRREVWTSLPSQFGLSVPGWGLT